MASLTELRDTLESVHMGQGRKWVESMRRYYDRRLQDLKAAEPTQEDTD